MTPRHFISWISLTSYLPQSKTGFSQKEKFQFTTYIPFPRTFTVFKIFDSRNNSQILNTACVWEMTTSIKATVGAIKQPEATQTNKAFPTTKYHRDSKTWHTPGYQKWPQFFLTCFMRHTFVLDARSENTMF